MRPLRPPGTGLSLTVTRGNDDPPIWSKSSLSLFLSLSFSFLRDIRLSCKIAVPLWESFRHLSFFFFFFIFYNSTRGILQALDYLINSKSRHIFRKLASDAPSWIKAARHVSRFAISSGRFVIRSESWEIT